MTGVDTPKCEGCYKSFSGWWCDNCDQWPCNCVVEDEEATPMRELKIKIWPEHNLAINPDTWDAFPEDINGTYLAVPKVETPRLVEGYLAYLKDSVTTKVCKCLWAVHPDDVDLDTEADVCRFCGGCEDAHVTPIPYTTQYPRGSEMVTKQMYCVEFKKPRRRMHKMDDHPECPIHTESGRILGFFEWLFPLPQPDLEAIEQRLASRTPEENSVRMARLDDVVAGKEFETLHDQPQRD